MTPSVRLLLLLIAALWSQLVCSGGYQSIVFLPLDERFTTRDAFLNLATLTPYPIVTTPFDSDLLPHHKEPVDMQGLASWYTN